MLNGEASSGVSQPSDPNFGIHGSSIITRSNVAALAWNAVVIFS